MKTEEFIFLLDKVRENTLNEENLEVLNSRYNIEVIRLNSDSIILSPINLRVNVINDDKLNKLTGTIKIFNAIIKNTFNNFPTNNVLKLKVGAKVMLIKNDSHRRWVNGDLGIIEQINLNSVVIRLDRNKEQYIVEKYIWENYSYKWNQTTNQIEKEVVGTFEQLPIKLAWAITIYKSQGHTFDKVIIDGANAGFATGQIYVALSRCTTFEGISLVNFISSEDIRVDSEVINFLEQQNENSMDREKFETTISGLEKKLDFLEKENSNQKQKINEIEKDNANLASEFNRIKKQNSTKGNVIKVLILLIIALIILMFIRF